MPHKHTRRRGDDHSNFNLAPSTIARPLPTYTNRPKTAKKPAQSRMQSLTTDSNGYKHDDTPRAFARMMELQNSKKRQRSGLDDGSPRSSKKRKSGLSTSETTEPPQPEQPIEEARADIPKILPGERLGDFAARVDQALPVGGLKSRGKVSIDGVKLQDRPQTKKEKKMQKMYTAWRTEDAKIKERLAEQKELVEDEEAEAEMEGRKVEFTDSNRSRKKRRRGGEDDDGDPWAVLKERREGRKAFNDVVQAPPQFKAVPREKFKLRNLPAGAKVEVSDVPRSAGSLKRREELGVERRSLLEAYRSKMKVSTI